MYRNGFPLPGSLVSVFSNRVDRSIGQTIDPTRGSGAEPDCTHLVAKDLLSYDFTSILLSPQEGFLLTLMLRLEMHYFFIIIIFIECY